MKFNNYLISKDKPYFDLFSKYISDLDKIGNIDGLPLFMFSRGKGSKTVCVSAGIHGNEKAGVFAALSLLKQEIPKDIKLIVFPCLNPYGFERDIRRNGDNLDLNRHFFEDKCKEIEIVKNIINKVDKINFFVSLHEFHEKKDEFYLFHSNYFNKFFYQNILSAGKRYFKVKRQEIIFDFKSNKDGLISHENNVKMEDGSFEHWMLVYHGVPYITTETPANGLMIKRVNCQKAIINKLFKAL